MKDTEIYSELSSIRSLMERSSKCLSLSGLSGILAGCYALVAAYFAYPKIYDMQGNLPDLENFKASGQITYLIALALSILILALLSGLILSIRQANKSGQRFWSAGSKRLMLNLALPLLSGGIFIAIMMLRAEYTYVVALALIFYGLALVSASHYTFSDVKYLGLSEIILGLLCAAFPAQSLIFWIIGFGFLHLLYGALMHFKYKQ